ncbi:MAG: AEC family transporter [Mariprofundaceae bacterium]
MFGVILGMAAIIAVGVAWRLLLGRDAALRLRAHLAQAVYQVFLPALVLHVLWRTAVDINSLRIPVIAAVCVLLSLLAAFLIYGNGRLVHGFTGKRSRAAIGALLLASAFGNFTYLGLPVLTHAFGEWSQFIAIQFDLLASTPLLFTVGIMTAAHFGGGRATARPVVELARVPAFHAAVAGLLLSLWHVPMPGWLDGMLATLGQAVVPLMLLSVGMALGWRRGWLARIPLLAPALAIQLGLMPVVAWTMAELTGASGSILPPIVIEAAMPSMVLGLVICDRFRLDAELYAEAVTLSTALSLVTLPLWMGLLQA